MKAAGSAAIPVTLLFTDHAARWLRALPQRGVHQESIARLVEAYGGHTVEEVRETTVVHADWTTGKWTPAAPGLTLADLSVLCALLHEQWESVLLVVGELARDPKFRASVQQVKHRGASPEREARRYVDKAGRWHRALAELIAYAAESNILDIADRATSHADELRRSVAEWAFEEFLRERYGPVTDGRVRELRGDARSQLVQGATLREYGWPRRKALDALARVFAA